MKVSRPRPRGIGGKVKSDLKTEVKHTAGPWEVFGQNYIKFPESGLECDCLVITEKQSDGHDEEIAAVYGPEEVERPEIGPKVERYARLIAAAPTMYAQLQAGIEALETALAAPLSDETFDYIRGVIAGHELAIKLAKGV